MENRAQLLSGKAADEAAEATGMLKDISKLEQELPSALKVRAHRLPPALRRLGGLTCVLLHVQEGVETMASLLGDLTGAASRSSEDFDRLQQDVEQNRAAAESLLKEGRTSAQVPSALVFNQGLNL